MSFNIATMCYMHLYKLKKMAETAVPTTSLSLELSGCDIARSGDLQYHPCKICLFIAPKNCAWIRLN